MQHSKSVALKPCPFCGSTNLTPYTEHFGTFIRRWSGAIDCESCGVTMHSSSGYHTSEEDAEADAIAAWNTRAPQPSPVPDQSADLVEAVARALKSVHDDQMQQEAALSEGSLDFEPGPWEEWVPEARAAIAAMDNATEKQIVTWLRSRAEPHKCRADNDLADAIERGAYKKEQ